MAKDVAVYEFNGIKYQQTFLTIGQTAKIADLFEQFDFSNLNAVQIFGALIKNGGLEKFFNLILAGEKKLDVSNLTPSQALEVLEDFLSYNGIYNLISRIFSILTRAGQNMSPEAFLKMTPPPTSTN